MRWVPNKTFPYPVLSSEHAPADRDYVNREFQATPQLEIQPASKKGAPKALLTIFYTLSEQSLLNLIKQGKAKYATEVHCRQTYLRRLLTSSEPKHEVEFNKGDLHERVEISSYVVCVESVQGHTSDTFHHEFGKGKKFNIESGDVLAVAHPLAYWFQLDFAKVIGTIFELVKTDKPDRHFSVNWDSDKLQIIMNQQDYGKFASLQNNSKMHPFLLSSVYLNTLTETLRIIRDDEDGYADKKWFGVIQQELANKDIALRENTDFLKEAQKLLGYPVHSMMTDENE